jgi:xylan 1,4-beta-xylosidase
MHDGPFCAALAARFALDVDDLVDAASWWTFSDIFEENYFPSVPFHGGFGLLNLHGVAKPVYRGFQLLGRLGTRTWPAAGAHPTLAARVGGGDDDAWTAVLVTNVAMPRHAIAAGRASVRLAGLRGRRPRRAHVVRIDDTHANAKAAWVAMGAPEYPLPHQVDALHAASALVEEPLEVEWAGDALRFALVVPANALALVRIDWEAAA